MIGYKEIMFIALRRPHNTDAALNFETLSNQQSLLTNMALHKGEIPYDVEVVDKN